MKPAGSETTARSAMLEAQKRQEGTSRRIARLVIVSDFATNNGSDPLEAARQLKGQGVPVVTVGLGHRKRRGGSPRYQGARHRRRPDRLREKPASTCRVTSWPRVRQPDAQGRASASKARTTPVAKTQVKVPDGTDVIPITGL